MYRNILMTAFLFLCYSACISEKPGQAPVAEDYPREVEEWKAERVETLKEPTGWLRLAGMFWLEEGIHSFGSGAEADVRFPEGSIPELAGTFELSNQTVTMTAKEGVRITYNGEAVEEMILYEGDETPSVEHEHIEWHVIEREELIGIRLYNKDNPKADLFTGFPRYDIDPKWHLNARYIPNPEGTTVSIVNVMGQQIDAASPGILEFVIDGTTYTLDAIESTEQMFIILSDETSRTDTYQAGRYMYIDYPEDGSDYTVIDFNKAYNPPCAYSRFTTCQLPPQQNRLGVAITVGEKRPVGWDGL